MKKANRKFITLGITLGLASGYFASPALAATSAETVSLTTPTISDVQFNSIATWNPTTQKACLYSANSLKAPANSDLPWVASNSCVEWEPPAGTPSGIYVASWDKGRSRALLVNSASPASPERKQTLVLVPDFTWQAYDLVANGNFYFQKVGTKSKNFSDRKLNLLRPMDFITVGDPKNYPAAPQLFPSSNPIQFLRQNLQSVEVVSESNFDGSNYDLSKFQTIVLYGHDEYWTAKIRDALEKAVADGTSLLNLSGNTGYRKLVRTGDVIGFDPPTASHPQTSRWGDAPGESSDVKLLGASYLGEPFEKRQANPIKVSNSTLGAMRADGLPKSINRHKIRELLRGMRVTDASNSLFRKTGLKDGEFFGFRSSIESIELDGIPESASGKFDESFLKSFGTTQINAAAESWINARATRTGRQWRVGQLIQTTFGKGKVFTAGPIGWAYAIANGDKIVDKITLNALNALGQETIG